MFFLGLTEFICLIGLAVSVIGFVVNAIRKKSKRKLGVIFLISFTVLVICIAITPDSIKNKDNEDEVVAKQTVQESETKDHDQEKELEENLENKTDSVNVSENIVVEKTDAELFADKYGVSIQLAESIDSVLSDMKLTDKSRVGVFHYTIADVKSWKKLDDWAEGERYSGYMAEEHIWYFYIKDDAIVGVRDGNGNIYYLEE